ncbi:MAG: hypothetical protein DWQ07_23915 [Chloroflexi bacterium]|nr:MAG: hypothetical protein DWQ07_23915 [Chloroflexota bacterium]MBL1194195.1 hypothetical protein [Chloroflexota bacterium]NOH11488.1 hypothetical protein [Chloroflexota bacterium]
MADFQIHDLHIHTLKAQESGKIILRDDDHLLRRFGQAELQTMAAGTQTDFTQRIAADELWAVLDGVVSFDLIDQRPNSPTYNAVDSFSIAAKDNQALLIPFGVAYALESDQDSQLLRLATHADDTHTEDQVLPRNTFVERLSQA